MNFSKLKFGACYKIIVFFVFSFCCFGNKSFAEFSIENLQTDAEYFSKKDNIATTNNETNNKLKQSNAVKDNNKPLISKGKFYAKMSAGINVGTAFDALALSFNTYYDITNKIAPMFGVDINWIFLNQEKKLSNLTGNFLKNDIKFGVKVNQKMDLLFKFGTKIKLNKNYSMTPYAIVGTSYSKINSSDLSGGQFYNANTNQKLSSDESVFYYKDTDGDFVQLYTRQNFESNDGFDTSLYQKDGDRINIIDDDTSYYIYENGFYRLKYTKEYFYINGEFDATNYQKDGARIKSSQSEYSGYYYLDTDGFYRQKFKSIDNDYYVKRTYLDQSKHWFFKGGIGVELLFKETFYIRAEYKISLPQVITTNGIDTIKHTINVHDISIGIGAYFL